MENAAQEYLIYVTRRKIKDVKQSLKKFPDTRNN